MLVVVLLALVVVVKSTPPLSPPPLRVPEIDLATNRRANDKADCDEDGCIFISSLSCQPICFVGKTDETKRKAKKARTNPSAATKHRPETRSRTLNSLSVCVVVFKADLSLFNLSPFVSCGGKQQSVVTLNKEEAKKLEHKSRGVKKARTPKLLSESALFSLCVVFSSVLFRANVEIIPSEVRGDLLSLSTKVRFSPLLI